MEKTVPQTSPDNPMFHVYKSFTSLK